MKKKSFLDREKKMVSIRNYGYKEEKYLKEILESGKLSSLAGGTFTPRFEDSFAKLNGSRYAVAMNSCMSALHAALICANVGAGDEVICDSEFIFGAMAVLYTNAIPVFVDIDPITHNMNPDLIEPLITERTKALIVTHAWGLPAEMDKITSIAKKHKLFVVEDCAEAMSASYKGKFVGNWGDIGCFSFQSSKHLSLGDGGMAVTNNEKLFKELGNHAGAPTFLSVAHSLDYNYRITEQTSAIGLAQLDTLPKTIELLAKNAGHYDQAVAGCKWIKLQRGPAESIHTFYHWAATFCGEEYGIELNDFKKAIERANIASVSIGYTQIPAYRHPLIEKRLAHAFHCSDNKGHSGNYDAGTCPVAERIIPRIVMGYVLETEEMAKREAEKIYNVIYAIGK